MISATKNLSVKSMANIFTTYFYSASCEEPALVTSHYTSCMHQFTSAASVLELSLSLTPFLAVCILFSLHMVHHYGNCLWGCHCPHGFYVTQQNQ